MIHPYLIIMGFTYAILLVGIILKSDFFVSISSLILIALGVYGLAVGIPYDNGTQIITYTNGSTIEKPIIAHLPQNDLMNLATGLVTLFIGIYCLIVFNLNSIDG